MAQHKFKIGQPVDFMPDKLQTSAPSGEYKITRLLPAEGRDRNYRIKNSAEPFERTARESQLTQRSTG